MTPHRITSAYVARLGPALGSRDRDIIEVLRRVRVATAHHIQRLCYPTNTPLSGARMARRALRRLVELRVVSRLDRAPGGHGGGRPGDVFTLDVAARRLLAPGPTHGHAPRRPWPVSRLFLNHSLSVSEWYCQLVETDRHGQVELLDFSVEPDCWRSFFGPGGGRAVVKPDAFTRLRLEGGEWDAYYFLEVDRGTEGPAALRRQLERYIRYWQSGTEQSRHQVFPRVAWIVPTPERHAWLVDLIHTLPLKHQSLFRVATETDALNLLLSIENSP